MKEFCVTGKPKKLAMVVSGVSNNTLRPILKCLVFDQKVRGSKSGPFKPGANEPKFLVVRFFENPRILEFLKFEPIERNFRKFREQI